MANPSVETVNTSGDKLMLALGVLLVWPDSWASSAGQAAVVCPRCRIGGIIAGVAVGLMSAPGKSLIAFAKDSYGSPQGRLADPQGSNADHLVVFGFVLVMAIFLWLSDKSIEWVIFSAILGWK
jgi:preprotein translocase subunit SecE